MPRYVACPRPPVLFGARASTALCVVWLAGCGSTGDAPTEPAGAGGADAASEADWFTDQAETTGLDFTHFNGMSGAFYQPEIMAPGVALFDFDNDGDLDVYLVQGQLLGTGPALMPPADPPHDRLFRNDLEAGPDGPRLRFTDVTAEAGIDARGYGVGVATGDVDNDGWVDLYLTGFKRNQLFRNNGDGTFADVSVASGTDAPDAWGVSAAFVDFDRDGWLDLFVGNYLRYSLETHTPCFNRTGPPDYCPPEMYRAEPSRLYRNRGDGTFADVTVAAGLAGEFGPALGVSTADFDGDGWIDIFVANDQQANQLWVNRHDGTFENMALRWGVALGGGGEAKADMGVDAGDFDNDGDEDLFITELTGQGATLYVNDGSGLFEDQSARAGVRLPTLPYTGFGAGWLDVDNDGWLDVLAVNGLVAQNLETLGPDNPFPLDQRNLLLRNLGNGRFEDATGRAGAVFRLSEVGRGAAFGDVDNDGDTDVLVGNVAGPVRLLINGVGSRRHWLGLRLVSANEPGPATSSGHPEPVGRRDMVGARVAIMRPDGSTLWRRARADGSYASANDPRVLVGLGESSEAVRIRVTWPSGRVEAWDDMPVDRYTTLREGEGR